jgi:hypothetical protein
MSWVPLVIVGVIVFVIVLGLYCCLVIGGITDEMNGCK